MRRLGHLLLLALLARCGAPVDPDDDAGTDAGPAVERDAGLPDAGLPDADAGVTPDASIELDAGDDAGPGDAGADAGRPLDVDRTSPQLFTFQFRASVADPPDAGRATGNQLAALDTRVAPLGKLVVYLHGAGAPGTCGSAAHNAMLAGFGYHVISPCYVSDYGVGNCGADIGGCRLEAFEGVDRSQVIDIAPSESIEVRVVKMLQRLAAQHPQGDWAWFLENGQPRWSRIVISGISHGASTAGLVGLVRPVDRVVMLSGPLDTNQAWLTGPSLTPRERFWGFTHQQDPQHAGHLAAFNTLLVPGTPVNVITAAPPWSQSHRLFSTLDAGTGNTAHSSTELNGASPRWPDGGARYAPVWRALYTE